MRKKWVYYVLKKTAVYWSGNRSLRENTPTLGDKASWCCGVRLSPPSSVATVVWGALLYRCLLHQWGGPLVLRPAVAAQREWVPLPVVAVITSIRVSHSSLRPALTWGWNGAFRTAATVAMSCSVLRPTCNDPLKIQTIIGNGAMT